MGTLNAGQQAQSTNDFGLDQHDWSFAGQAGQANAVGSDEACHVI